jgi:YD repeat-containing protein
VIEEYGVDATGQGTVLPTVGGRTRSELGPEAGGQCVPSAPIPGMDQVVQVGRPIPSSPASPSVPLAMPVGRQGIDDRTLRDPRYDAAGRLTGLTVVPPAGRAPETWAFTVDDEDRVVEVTAHPDDGSAVRTWSYQYDEVGNIVEQRSPDGAATRYEYDERDAIAVTHETDGRTVRYAYDERGYLALRAERSADGADERVVEYQHDGLGRLRRIVDHTAPESAQITELSYDLLTLETICQR